MKSNALVIIALFLSSAVFSQTTIFQDNFDIYSSGISIASQSSSWQTWSLGTGGIDDALISNDYASSGNKSMNIINENDIVYPFGERTSGSYNVEFKIFIKDGKGAYLNVEHGNRIQFAFEAFFKENKQLWFDNGTDSVQISTFETGEWFTIRLFVDLNNDILRVYKNEVLLKESVFSKTMNNSPFKVLGLIDFYGIYNNSTLLGINNSNFYIDDFKFTEIVPPDPVGGCGLLNYFANRAAIISGTYTDLGSNGSVITTSDFDNANSSPVNIGFTFNFNCQSFTQFILNTNGFIKLGNTPPSSPSLFFDGANTAGGGIFNSTNSADMNLISPFNHDLTTGTGTPEYRVFTSGSSPDRVCTIQFKNVRDKTSTPAQQYDNIEFQIKLYETTNIIEFVYGNWVPAANVSAFKTSACGLKGSTIAGKDLLVVNKGSTYQWNNVAFSNANYSTTATLNFGNPPERPKPESGLTYRFIPAYNTNLSVNRIYTMGEASVVYSSPQIITANIANSGITNLTNVIVNLEITGSNSFSTSATIPVINPNSNIIISFSSFTPSNTGANTITVTLPADDFASDNQLTGTQNTTDYTIKYASAGSNNASYPSGFIYLAKYHINSTASVYSVEAYISASSNNIGKSAYSVIVNQSATILGQSDEYVIQGTDLGKWHSFEINEKPSVSNMDIYAGFASSGTGYFPLGAQIENPYRTGTFYSMNIGGTSLYTESTDRLMIGVTLSNVTGAEIPGDVKSIIQLFPNPANNILTVIGLSQPATTFIYTINGELVKTFLMNQTSNVLDIKDLPSGLYLLRIQSGNEISMKKFIKY